MGIDAVAKTHVSSTNIAVHGQVSIAHAELWVAKYRDAPSAARQKVTGNQYQPGIRNHSL